MAIQLLCPDNPGSMITVISSEAVLSILETTDTIYWEIQKRLREEGLNKKGNFGAETS